MFIKLKTLGAIYDQIRGDGSQISWTERHEALFMSFCPKSNNYSNSKKRNFSIIPGNNVIPNAVRDLRKVVLCLHLEISHCVRDDVIPGLIEKLPYFLYGTGKSKYNYARLG